MIGTHVFEGEIMGIKYPLTKTITLVFHTLESKSFDENQKVFSGKSIAQWLRELYKNLKAIKKDFKRFKRIIMTHEETIKKYGTPNDKGTPYLTNDYNCLTQ